MLDFVLTLFGKSHITELWVVCRLSLLQRLIRLKSRLTPSLHIIPEVTEFLAGKGDYRRADCK